MAHDGMLLNEDNASPSPVMAVPLSRPRLGGFGKNATDQMGFIVYRFLSTDDEPVVEAPAAFPIGHGDYIEAFL